MSETIKPSYVEKRWGISQKSQMNARRNGTMCPWIALNGHVYYKLDTFLKWIDELEAASHGGQQEMAEANE